MNRTLIIVAAALVAADASALTFHRSFSSVGVGVGGGMQTSVPVDAKVAKALAEGLEAEAKRPRVVIGRVSRVLDGSTFNLFTNGGSKYTVRLRDATEPSGGKVDMEARARLKKLIDGRTVRVEFNAHDEAGRLLGEVTLDKRSVNKAMSAAKEKEVKQCD